MSLLPGENPVETESAAVGAGSIPEAPGATGESPVNLQLSVLAIVALVAALYLARAFFVPLLIGILASYALRPVVEWLQAHYIPRFAGAALVLFLLAGGLSWVVYSLRDDTAVLVERLPEAAHKLRQNLSAVSGHPTPLQSVQEAANEIQGAAIDASAKPGTRTPVKAPEPTTWLRDYVLAQSASLFSVVAQTPIVLLLTYFLLASGNHFRRKLLGLVGPSLSRKKDAMHILGEIDVQVQRYLLVMLVSNALTGVITWLAFAALGLEHAGVLGATAGALHFIPYLGAVLTALICGVAALLQFGSLLQALAVAGVSLLVAGAVGFVFTTWLQSRFARVNAAVLFIVLLFFGWLWGIWGLLLGAPLLAIAKVICDRIHSLKPLGELLGR